MMKFSILNKIADNAFKFFLMFFLFRVILMIIYVIGGYQDFTIDSSKLILRFIMSNEVFLASISLLCAAVIIRRRKNKFIIKAALIIFFASNMIFSFFAVTFCLLVIAFA